MRNRVLIQDFFARVALRIRRLNQMFDGFFVQKITDYKLRNNCHDDKHQQRENLHKHAAFHALLHKSPNIFRRQNQRGRQRGQNVTGKFGTRNREKNKRHEQPGNCKNGEW